MKRLGFATIAALSVSLAFAAAPEVEKRLREQYPATTISAVRESDVAGIYEVVMGRNSREGGETGQVNGGKIGPKSPSLLESGPKH